MYARWRHCAWQLVESRSGDSVPSGCPAVMRPVEYDSAVVGNLVAAQFGDPFAHPGHVHLAAVCEVGAQVRRKLMGLAELGGGHPGPCIYMACGDQGGEGGVFSDRGPVVADPTV